MHSFKPPYDLPQLQPTLIIILNPYVPAIANVVNHEWADSCVRHLKFKKHRQSSSIRTELVYAARIYFIYTLSGFGNLLCLSK